MSHPSPPGGGWTLKSIMKKYIAHHNGQEIEISEQDAYAIYKAFKHNLLLEDAEDNFKIEIDYAVWFLDQDEVRSFAKKYGYTPEQAMDPESPYYRMERIATAFENLKETSDSDGHAWTAAVEAILNADETQHSNHKILLAKAAEKLADEFYDCSNDCWPSSFAGDYGFTAEEAMDPVSPNYVLDRIARNYQEQFARFVPIPNQEPIVLVKFDENAAWYKAVHTVMAEIQEMHTLQVAGETVAKLAIPVLIANDYTKEMTARFVTLEGRKELLKMEGGGCHAFGGLNANGETICINVNCSKGIEITTYLQNGQAQIVSYNKEGAVEDVTVKMKIRQRGTADNTPWFRRISNDMASMFGTVQGRKNLIEFYGKYAGNYAGVNEHNEMVLLSIRVNGIAYTCYQENGWIRVNRYDEDGLMTDEQFEGRWR